MTLSNIKKKDRQEKKRIDEEIQIKKWIKKKEEQQKTKQKKNFEARKVQK